MRAILGLPIGKITQYGPCASAVILGEGKSDNIRFQGMGKALALPDTQLRLFGKPDIDGRRRLGGALAKDSNIDNAVTKAKKVAAEITVIL